MEDYIKIPKDFKSLHELKDLVNNYDLVTRLSEALNGYQRMYLDSYLMTYDDVLKFIPESQHEIYKVQIRDESSDYLMRSYVGEKKEGADKNGYRRHPLSEILLGIDVSKKDKAFLVNVEDKIIDVCFWFDSAILDSKALETKKNNREKEKLNFVKTKNKADVTYTGKMNFSLNSETRMLEIHAHYVFVANQAVGGVWINGRARGYLSGETYHDYDINGYDIYHFCTKTNKYMGHKGHKQDKYKGWMEIKSRY